MRHVLIIAGREIQAYLASPIAYVVTAMFLFFSGTFFVSHLAGISYADTTIVGFVQAGRILILVFAALLTMGLVADERKTGTWELLMAAPVRKLEIVLGKFLASYGLLLGILVLTLYYPLLLFVFGDPDLGPIVTSYVGLALLGAAAMAAGLFASSLTSNQLVAAVLAGGILFALWFLGAAGRFLPETAGAVLTSVSLSGHFPPFLRGVIDLRDVVYYLSVAALFLFLAVETIENGRWR